MGKLILKTEIGTEDIKGEKKLVRRLDSEEFNKFNPSILGLGDISLRSTRVEAIAAVFDLSGFTHFCSQVDPHLAVPEYLSRFLDWLFDEVKQSFVRKSYSEGKELWAELPFLAKYLGDGVLFLWDTAEMDITAIGNVVVSLKEICDAYKQKLYPEVINKVVEPPDTLRCGIARGSVLSVGEGEDYVGPCINIASRLQKMSLLTFCFSRRGFDIEAGMVASWKNKFMLKSVSLRGIGENELVWVLKEEFDNLAAKEKKLFGNP